MNKHTLKCGCIVRQYDSVDFVEPAIPAEMDVEWCVIHDNALSLAIMLHRLARELSMAHRDTGCNNSNCSTKLLLDEYDTLTRDIR